MKQPCKLKKRYSESVQALSFLIFPHCLFEITWYLSCCPHMQVRAHVLLQKESNSLLGTKTDSTKAPEKNIEKAITLQPFINEHVLVDATSVSIPLCFANFMMYNPFHILIWLILQKFFPGTAEKFFSVILGDNSMFFQQYRDARKDTDFKVPLC